jgi:hypothetical protein
MPKIVHKMLFRTLLWDILALDRVPGPSQKSSYRIPDAFTCSSEQEATREEIDSQ